MLGRIAMAVLAIIAGAYAWQDYQRFSARKAIVSALQGDNAPERAEPPSCTLSSITIKSMRASFVDECQRKSCPSLRGVAVMTNGCPEAIGVQVKIVGLDSLGAPVSVRDPWPANVSNIPPGDYTFSLDHLLDYDSRIKSFTLQPIALRRWRER